MKNLCHLNIQEIQASKAQIHREIQVYWIPAKYNPADLFTKEHKDLAQFNKLCDLMVCPRKWIHDGCRESPSYSTNDAISKKKEIVKYGKSIVNFKDLDEVYYIWIC